MPRFHVIIPAAGSGSRMAMDAPKQYLKLKGKPLIHHVIQVFAQSTKVDTIHVVLNPDDTVWNSADNQLSQKMQIHYCGGTTRAASVLNTLNAIEAQVAADDWVLVHDAARPGLSNALLNKLMNALQDDPVGGLLALPLADTLKRADEDHRVAMTLPRDNLWQAQTPQMFKFSTLKRALTEFNGTPTDESEAIEALGLKPKLISGELRNMKVTYPQDLVVLAALLDITS
jgi:2-C-methyl-D-erythritol 4-phosphate cytidylyltransferase